MVRGAEARRDVQPAATTLRVNKVKPGISRAGMERRAEILGRPAQGIQRRRTAGNHINARVRIMSVSSRASLGGTIAQGSIRGVPATNRFNVITVYESSNAGGPGSAARITKIQLQCIRAITGAHGARSTSTLLYGNVNLQSPQHYSVTNCDSTTNIHTRSAHSYTLPAHPAPASNAHPYAPTDIIRH